ncbi:terminase large subunit domain-containing protein [Demequina iriomotensis]|uniref:terminase large subunit domain-containing protein n=1 Tax=Demequina iriomotensis TaxID=1536641 RepID=UPI0014704CA3|nr:terminase family protein [Demequina iriomotensis]
MGDLGRDLAAALDPVRFAAGLGFEAERWQARLVRSRARRVLVACARQVGKTTTTSLKALHVAVYEPGSLVLIISPSQRQSDEMLLRVKALYRALGQAKPSRDSGSELVLENGSRIVSLPGTEGTSRGFAGAKLIVLDEAARVPDDIFASVLPMVASDGAIWALSTPWGRRGWFFEGFESREATWEKHRVTVYESAQYDDVRIAEVRAALGGFVFASDYECVFGDTDTQLFGSELVRAAFTSAVKELVLP